MFGILAVIALASCQPGSNPTQPLTTPTSLSEPINTPLATGCNLITTSNDIGLTILILMDRSQIYLGANTEIAFIPTGYCQGLKEHHVLLKKGQVAVSSQLPKGEFFQINSPDGYLAQVSKSGLITFDPVERSFRLSCKDGPCALGVSADKLVILGCGESAVLDGVGNFSGPTTIVTASLLPFGE